MTPDTPTSNPTPFGAPMREHFLLGPGYKNFNHGSFGTYPAAVQTVLRQFQSEAEAQPDVFIRHIQPRGIDLSRQAVASFLNAPVGDCVFVKNATTGVGTILQNLEYAPGDVIVCFDTIYGGVEKSLESLMEQRPVLQTRKVSYTYPISHEDLVERFRAVVSKAREEGLNVRAAVFDVVVSNPGVRFPFERLTEVCREEGILSLIDGAHGIGHLPLDLAKLNPDFFTTNLHKWLYVPRGCALLYVPLRNQHLIRTTLPTSWGFIPAPDSPPTAPSVMVRGSRDGPAKSAFEQLFEFVATSDDTPYMCVPAALKFRAEVCGGEDAIYAYMEKLANEGGDVVAQALGTEVLQEPGLKAGEVSLVRKCAMSTVRLPIRIEGEESSGGADSDYVIQRGDVQPLCKWIQTVLMDSHATFVPVFAHGPYLWTRLSAQVYLEKSEFEWLGGVLKEICEKVAQREWS